MIPGYKFDCLMISNHLQVIKIYEYIDFILSLKSIHNLNSNLFYTFKYHVLVIKLIN